MKKLFSFMLMATMAVSVAMADTQVTVDCGGSAKITATPQTGYDFVAWLNAATNDTVAKTAVFDLTDIQGNATYKAYFKIKKYAIKWVNDGTILRTDTVEHFQAVTYGTTDPTPTRDATAQYTFTFAGWSPTIVSPAVGDATYIAEYDTTVNKYTVTFKNWDGSVLEAKEWEYGSTPTYEHADPTRPTVEGKEYAFSGWKTEGGDPINMVTGDVTYIAQFNETSLSYTVTVLGENGVVSGGGSFQWGLKTTLTATPNACYEFVSWNDGDTNPTREVTVTGDVTYTAIFKKITYTITVESDDDTMGTVSVEKVL